jgi:hypothetical protein
MSRRFTGRQITTMVVAVCLAVIAFPVGSFAAGLTTVRVADSIYSTRVAHVTAQGRLTTDTCDNDSCASVDAGKQRVGDGSGALTVDGSVLPYNPGTAFSRMIFTPGLIKPGLTSGKIMITSLSFTNPSSAAAVVTIRNLNTSGTGCGVTLGDYVYDGLVSAASTLVVTFPSPLVATRCAFANNLADSVTVTGYVLP